MTDVVKKTPGHLALLISWLKGQWVRDVPPESALCEFDCRKEQCLEGEWISCDRRLTRAAGELMPGPPAKPQEPQP